MHAEYRLCCKTLPTSFWGKVEKAGNRGARGREGWWTAKKRQGAIDLQALKTNASTS